MPLRKETLSLCQKGKTFASGRAKRRLLQTHFSIWNPPSFTPPEIILVTAVCSLRLGFHRLFFTPCHRPPSRRLGYSSHRRLGYSFTPPLQSLSPPLHHAAWVPCLAPCVEGSTYPLLWSLFIHNSHVNMFAGGGARIRVCQGFGEGLLGLFFAVLGSSGLSWWLCWVFFVFGLKIEI
jgi:hypothetical protein